MSEVPGRLLREALQATGSGLSPGCLDAETLARWADDTLNRKERVAVEAHAAGCARCQATLAALERIAPPPVPRSWFRWSTVGWLAPLTAAAALLVWLAVAPPVRSTQSAPAAQQARAAPSPADAPIFRDELKESADRERDVQVPEVRSDKKVAAPARADNFKAAGDDKL